MSHETGGQAFPTPATDWNMYHEGMTLRDYFAGQAMQESRHSQRKASTTPSNQGKSQAWS